MTFFGYLKNLLIFLFFLQVTPKLMQSISSQYSAFIVPKTRVGVLRIDGVLYHSSWHTKQLHRFFIDDSIKAILLKIESSGSCAGTGQALAHEIIQLKTAYPKPIIALTENVCASGAYYIASATDYVISSGQALIGSIGSYIPHLFQLKGFLENHNIDYTPIKAGTYKGMTDPFSAMNEQDKEQLQSVVDDSYTQFVADIAHNRKLAIQDAKTWADGKIFTGKQAQKLGLVDELGSAINAITYIKNKKLIDDIEWIHAQPQGGFLQQLFSPQDSSDPGSMFNQCDMSIATCVQAALRFFGALQTQALS